jgi:hypothetical protein
VVYRRLPSPRIEVVFFEIGDTLDPKDSIQYIMKYMGNMLLRVVLVLSLSSSVVAQDQQIGARTKAMGGSYTAFEDDPISIWLNPAGIATQSLQLSLSYQTYTAFQQGLSLPGPAESVDAEMIMAPPAFIPSYLGMVVPVGNSEAPMSLGICYVRPYYLDYALDEVTASDQTSFSPVASVQQSLSRFRVAFAYDFRFRDMGEAGFFSHLALGIGLDVGLADWKFSSPAVNETDSALAFGGGLGILLNVYNNTESFMVNFGMAYQSEVDFDFRIQPEIYPSFDMPHQINLGCTFFLLEGMPLRLTFDFQLIDWGGTAVPPDFLESFPPFEDSMNISIGCEYRIPLTDQVFLYPRLGYRRFNPPWRDEKSLPVTGDYRLVLDTEGDSFHIFSFGFGLSVSNKEGRLRAVDVAVDVGGDSSNVAVGYTHEF